jgi:hypothetical protein
MAALWYLNQYLYFWQSCACNLKFTGLTQNLGQL